MFPWKLYAPANREREKYLKRALNKLHIKNNIKIQFPKKRKNLKLKIHINIQPFSNASINSVNHLFFPVRTEKEREREKYFKRPLNKLHIKNNIKIQFPKKTKNLKLKIRINIQPFPNASIN